MSSRRFMPHPSRAANIVMRITRGVEEGNFRAWRRDTRVTARCCEVAGRRSKKGGLRAFQDWFRLAVAVPFQLRHFVEQPVAEGNDFAPVPFPGGLTSQ